MRYVAVDLGDMRSGLAVGDSVLRIAAPVDVIEVPISQRGGEALLDALVGAIDGQLGPARDGPAGELVVGLPMNMDGTEGPRATAVRQFAERLGARTGRDVRFFDERLSTAAADWAMARSGLTRREKKERRDALAATAILQGFLDALPPETSERQGAGWDSG